MALRINKAYCGSNWYGSLTCAVKELEEASLNFSFLVVLFKQQQTSLPILSLWSFVTIFVVTESRISCSEPTFLITLTILSLVMKSRVMAHIRGSHKLMNQFQWWPIKRRGWANLFGPRLQPWWYADPTTISEGLTQATSWEKKDYSK